MENTAFLYFGGTFFFLSFSLWFGNANFLYFSIQIKISHCTYSSLLHQSNALFSWSFALPSLKNSPEGSDRKWTYLNVPETDGDTVSSPESSALTYFQGFSLLSRFLLKTVPVHVLQGSCVPEFRWLYMFLSNIFQWLKRKCAPDFSNAIGFGSVHICLVLFK